MARFHSIDGEKVYFTDAEEAAQDKIDAEYAAGADERVLAEIRHMRNARIAVTDWWAFPDSPEMTNDQKSYRQKLRDFPSTIDPKTVDMANLNWPEEPS